MTTTLDVEIERHRAAMVRHEAALAEMREGARGGRCPQCAYGQTYIDACDRKARCAAWMRKLLTKRGRPDDLDLAEAIRITAWP